MCETCGCAVTGAAHHAHHHGHDHGHGHDHDHSAGERRTIAVVTDLLHENDHQAAHNRAHFDAAGIMVVNLMSSPGSGKTSLLEATIKALPPDVRIAVIEGDLETENDAQRIRRHGVPAVQITTGTACHLDAAMVHDALDELDLANVDLLFIENVGNLVCPAAFDLGQHRNVLLLSVTEGDDKPSKYPVMFRAADQVLITKTDLLPHLGDFEPARARAAVAALGRATPVLELSARTGDGLDGWIASLTEAVNARRAVPAPTPLPPTL